PTVSGAATGTVALGTNTSAGAVTIKLSGTGQAAAYEVDLNWDAPTDSAVPVTGYNVYRAVSGSSSYLLLNASVSTSYTDTTVQDGTAYTYYVVSVDAAGNQSAPSNLYSVTIP
ncbi:MAG TPA: fibronectin type III domain-containing protein, partial [Acidobacteriaceae bacterium]|nr:fibronectin type III domain-containing protein [Acidobacteriaceae bacterium]